ncbi:VOC family protein [Thalassotalea ponticola]|uniref:VOC family protein n=1 Tax=Thalassotalea ponticola TaxID=1523392 RepID=UPI0025B2ED75|nr:VOC family protein [Thalassotalea ponticola]MDN3653400.1 VOC family protein [Thalassotalea ponticola]
MNISEQQQKAKTLCHISLGTNQLQRASKFYDVVLATLDIYRVTEHEQSVAYGKGYPTFWLQIPYDQGPATVGNGSHIGFMATSKEQVNEFYRVAIDAGAQCNGRPGPRPEYGDAYYGCFVIDLDGHRIEASFWDVNYSK